MCQILHVVGSGGSSPLSNLHRPGRLSLVSDIRTAPTGERAKAFGAYYTPDQAVNFMVHWAVRQTDFNVIDPSFGNGVFLEASGRQVARPSEQIYGIELDEIVYNASKKYLKSHYQIVKLWQGNFFESDSFFEDNFERSSPVEAFEAVVGNPPLYPLSKLQGKRTSARARARSRLRRQFARTRKFVGSFLSARR